MRVTIPGDHTLLRKAVSSTFRISTDGTAIRNSYFAWIPSFWMTMEFFAAVVQPLSCVRLFTTPWTAEHRASLSLSLPEFAQVHVHWVSDAIQPSHPLSSPSLPTFNLFWHQGLFQGVSSSHQVAEVLELQLQHQSFQWLFRVVSFRIDWFDLLSVQGTLKSLLRHHNSKASILQHSAFFTVQL